MRKRKILAFFVCIVLVVALVAACGQMQQPKNQNNNNRNNNTNTPQGEQTRVVPRTVRPRTVVPTPGGETNIRNTTPLDNNGTNMNNNLGNNNRDNDDNEDYTERVRDIAERAAELKEIESATCVITGDTALIGVQFDEQYKGGVTNKIKEKVENVCKDEDPEIDRVIVTADPDIFARIQDMLKDIGEGRPVSGFVEEINELINRIQPK